MLDKKRQTESDARLRHINPAIFNAGWQVEQIFTEYYFIDGEVMVRGNTTKRKDRKFCDYLLTTTNLETPLAIVEAKAGYISVGDGMQQAIEYATILDVPFAYSTNGKGFLEHDMLTGSERELKMSEFPTHDALFERYSAVKDLNVTQQEVIRQPYYFDSFKRMKPRYYQRIAIDRTLEAVTGGQNRILLVMATGTGKTYTAFQIIWRLKQLGLKKKVLYLADRNILIDQTIQNDFKPFEKVITKVQGRELDSAYEIYMSLYQQMAGEAEEEPFRQFKPDFFDLIVVDECHRGSAREESLWRRVLDYFSSATQIGLTATPKESKEVSNIHYFGKPVYTYSLKQGIQDGFLAPFKVIRVHLDKDDKGWRPEKGKKDIEDNAVEDREYNLKDYDRKLIIDERTQTVAKRITEWLKSNDRFAKTIVFCVDIDHAERMRQALVNENTDMVRDNPKYVMRITGDNPVGKKQLDNFIDVKETYPTIVTTSKLMTTGVDCKTCKLIVLDSNIGSMTEFKQIIGRGTRLKEDAGKLYFTIMDFRGVTKLFADKDFDGAPVQIMEVPAGGDIDDAEEVSEDTKDDQDDWENGEETTPTGDSTASGGKPFVPPTGGGERVKKIRVNGVDVSIASEHVKFYDENGKLVTESLIDYSKKNILSEYATLDNFLSAWKSADKKQAIIDQLAEHGVLLEVLQEVAGNKDLDPFDLILHIAYDKPPLTRAERVKKVKKRGYLYQYDDTCQQVLNALLHKYMDDGVLSLQDTTLLSIDPFKQIDSPKNIAKLFGGKQAYLDAVRALQEEIYALEAA
ncbi:DEAD/DEAH box helicase family protein [Psychrobacter sp. Ps1]|uniref:EcoAI/FtnUII family type I restriction enzme subunit R n=1 Tax=Psychrobacter sp. Ps1 TaxID=2790955 RepID=UPI001EDEE02F|nr:DEAD/DEAH box helicase family protein [Psychrobacter sp. Ps1]MCG3841625.1 DEAD/DEAH box helicase family protein [Psychrobacter sp. Ps1]